MTCCAPGAALDERFGRAEAARQLRRYRHRGPPAATRLLLRGLQAAGVDGATLLDIGGGIGILQHELLAGGAARAVAVDASSAYLATAAEEAGRRGLAERVEYVHADFVAAAGRIAACEIVTLDRVICCYPDMPTLVRLSAERAGRLWAAVFPRERLLTRAGIPLVNLCEKARRSDFRVHLHAPAAIAAALRQARLAPRWAARTLMWEVVVWERRRAMTA